VFFIFNSSSPVSQYLLINFLRRFSEVSQSVQAAALRSTVSAHSLFTIFCIAKNLLLYRSLYIRKLLLGRHLNWTIDFLTPLCTVKRSFDSHAAEEQRTWSEFRISFFSSESCFDLCCSIFIHIEDILPYVVNSQSCRLRANGSKLRI